MAWIEDGARDVDGLSAPLPVGAKVRLHGRWGASGSLDGLPLRLETRTRFDDELRTGDYVEVRGVLDSDGRVVVDRVRLR